MSTTRDCSIVKTLARNGGGVGGQGSPGPLSHMTKGFRQAWCFLEDFTLDKSGTLLSLGNLLALEGSHL